MSRTPLLRQTRFADFAQDMEQELVRFLNARGRIAFYRKIDIGQAKAGPTVAAKQRDRFQFAFFSFLNRSPDIVRFAARANSDENVPAPSESDDLPRKDFFESVVIRGRRDQATALRQVQRRIRAAIFHEPARELGAKIRRIGRASPITADK